MLWKAFSLNSSSDEYSNGKKQSTLKQIYPMLIMLLFPLGDSVGYMAEHKLLKNKMCCRTGISLVSA